ncbi:hypothetical protein GCM10027275_32740 [Rhabdobacter roseus]|uniref:Uncharacterized protein n=1 Tax=Rhabdobacter roseus TaxID=1655419 RepID=A0A840TQ95_9BACT|nr:hypothetical protein [Rhabdobacter roseus]
MKIYRYKTKISESGSIQLPLNPALYDQEVEILILPKSLEKEQKLKAIDFITKWAGFLKSTPTDSTKYDYLMEKYK